MEFLLEPLTYAFFQRALLASLLVGALCGLIGVYIVLRRMSYIGHGLSHAVFGGAVVSALLHSAPRPTAKPARNSPSPSLVSC